MTRGLWLLGVLAFTLTLLVKLPAAWLMQSVVWPPGWRPGQATGTLWQGQVDQLGPLGPLAWQWQPWQGRLQMALGFERQAWHLELVGWPWRWQAILRPGPSAAGIAREYLFDGQWRGELRLAGQGTHCQQAEGELRGDQVALLAPWTLALGEARLTLVCDKHLQVQAEIQRSGEHHLNARLETGIGRVMLSGQVQAGAALRPPLVQAGWLKKEAQTFEAQLRLR